MFSHSDYKDPYAPPLAPKVKATAPPWVPSYREYNGRYEWWAELGHKDEKMRRGFNPEIFHTYRERDPFWFNPKVPDGTSVIGPFGLDSLYHRNLTKKADQPMTFTEHQKKVMESSAQYKNIVQKWDISPEHPGFAVSPLLEKFREDYRTLGTFSKIHYYIQAHSGPRFWDKPINEGCFMKGLSLVKYAAFSTLLIAWADTWKRDYKNIINFGPLFKDWFFNHLPIPASLAMTFGVTACISAQIRNIDDTWNWTFASIAAGTCHGTIRNKFSTGFNTSLVLILLFSNYQSMRMRLYGTQGMHVSQMFSGLMSPYTGPLGWKTIPVHAYDSTRSSTIPDGWKLNV